MKKYLFPKNDYTPYGYLDNPYHSWIANKSGIIRSVPPLGFSFYYPNFGQWYYCVGMNFDLKTGKRTERIRSDYHSKNIFSYNLACDGVEAEFLYFLASENSLVCEVRCKNSTGKMQEIDIMATAFLQVLLKQSRRWEFGITGRYDRDNNAVIMRSYAEGIAVSFSSSVKPASFQIADINGNSEKNWTNKYKGGELTSRLHYKLQLEPGKREQLSFVLTRDYQTDKLLKKQRQVVEEKDAILKQKVEEDNKFWENCPVLEGDFPELWKTGWVYDWETMRMCIRNPVGIFTKRWDAMQIQIPRVVLAETALDTLMYSYADVETAKEVILGTFEDSPAPQIPCIREDGSPNMVAEDGSECGTSPAWCWPFYSIYIVYRRCYDREWLKNLYPYLEKYLDWWLENRYNEKTGIFYKCSWESGQDSSRRFGREQPSGAELIEDISPVDLNVSMSQAGLIMAFFAGELEKEDKKWNYLENKFRAFLDKLWTDGGYYDFDCGSGEFIRVEDCTHVSPVMLDIPVERREKMRERFRNLVKKGAWWLEWGSFTFQLGECALALDERKYWADIVYENITRIYRYWNRRNPESGTKIPGIALEWWSHKEPGGAEGYGWGTTSPLAIIRHIIGFLEDDENGCMLVPSIPEKLWSRGKTLTIKNLSFKSNKIALSYKMEEEGNLNISLSLASERPLTFEVYDDKEIICKSGRIVKSSAVDFAGRNFGRYYVKII